MEKKHIRNKGKLKLSRYFQELDIGDNVAIKRELSLEKPLARLQGKIGVIEEKRGESYIIKVKDKKDTSNYF